MASRSFHVEPYRRKYLKDYSKRMSQDNLEDIFDDNVYASLRDQGLDIPENSRSIYRVSKLYEALDKYSPARVPETHYDSHVKDGIRLAYACFSRGGHDIIHVSRFTPQFVRSITSNLRGSAGLTNWGQNKADSITRAYERGLQTLTHEKSPEPCIAFKRSQFGDKTRLVWGYPYSMTAIEGLLARPLIDQFKDGFTPMAFATQTQVLGTKMRVSSYHNEFAYSLDVSSFDASASAPLIHVAFDILRTWFDLREIEPTSERSVRQIFDQVEWYFIHTPIVMPDLNIYKGKQHGVPSGSYFTQMIDSIINTIYIGAISSKFDLFVDKKDISVLGDDALFWSNHRVPLESIASYATHVFGCEFNHKKMNFQRYDQPITYLGRVWENGHPNLATEEILVRMCHPERFRKYSKDPVKREQEVNLLISSYVTTYRNAYPIWIMSGGDKVRTFNSLIELMRLGDSGSVDPDHLSGLMRYKRKYFDQETEGGTPLALQYWK